MFGKRDVSRRAVLTGIAGSSAVLGGIGTVTAAADSTGDEDEVYLVLGGGRDLAQRIESAGFEVRHELADGSVLIVRGPESRADVLRSMSVVVDVIPNDWYVVRDLERPASTAPEPEPLAARQWDKQLTRTTAAHEAATGDGTTLAVVDSGISHSHPEFASRLDVDRSRAFRDGRILDGTGEIAVAEEPLDRRSMAPTRTVTGPVADDVAGHGTHVAGIAAAGRNGAGTVGTAPDVTLLSLRALSFADTESALERDSIESAAEKDILLATPADVLLAIDYAVEIGADVVNVSIQNIVPGDSRLFAAYRRVIQHAIERGTVVVAAAGNVGIDLDRYTNYVLPADAPGSITVAATGPNDRRSYYSNYGDGTVDVAAPGGGYETAEKTGNTDPTAVDYPLPTNYVFSTRPESIYGAPYGYSRGTSMAAPQVAGAACLLRELDPDLHPRRVRQAITQSAVDLSGPYTSGLGTGRIDVPAALERIAHRR